MAKRFVNLRKAFFFLRNLHLRVAYLPHASGTFQGLRLTLLASSVLWTACVRDKRPSNNGSDHPTMPPGAQAGVTPEGQGNPGDKVIEGTPPPAAEPAAPDLQDAPQNHQNTGIVPASERIKLWNGLQDQDGTSWKIGSSQRP